MTTSPFTSSDHRRSLLGFLPYGAGMSANPMSHHHQMKRGQKRYEATNRRLYANEPVERSPRARFLSGAGRNDRAKLLSIRALQLKVHPLHQLSSPTTLPVDSLFQPRDNDEMSQQRDRRALCS